MTDTPESRTKEARVECQTCGSDDPTQAFDTIRPEKPIQPAFWQNSDDGWNWVCPDDFHRPAHPDHEPAPSESRVELAARLAMYADPGGDVNYVVTKSVADDLREAASLLTSPPEARVTIGTHNALKGMLGRRDLWVSERLALEAAIDALDPSEEA